MSRRVFALAASLAALGFAAGVFPPPTEAPAAPKPGATVDWPHFRFDKNHTGYQPHETALSKDTVKFAGPQWVADLPGELVYSSSPAVVNGTVYIGDIDGTLTARPAAAARNAARRCGSPPISPRSWIRPRLPTASSISARKPAPTMPPAN